MAFLRGQGNAPAQPGAGPGRFFRSTPGVDTTPFLTAISPDSDRLAGGAAVTINGGNFRSSTDGTPPVVLFGGVAATNVVVVSTSQLTCTAPAASDEGVVDVSVTCGSQTGTLFSAFTYYTGAITSVSPAYGPLAGGTTVLITGWNFVDGSTITIGGNAATDVQFIDDQHFSCVTPAHAVGFADVVITEPGGATSTLDHGFQYTLLTRGNDIRRQPGIVVRDVLNNAPNTCTFTVDGRSNKPFLGEQIEIVDEQDGDRLLFAGTVQSIEQIFEDQRDQLAWQVTAVDFTFQLNRRRPFGTYSQTSVSDIVRDLISRFCPGFTTDHVQDTLAKVTITFDGSQDVTTALSRLATMIGGGHWYVDYTRDVHFFHVVPPEVINPEITPETIIKTGASSSRPAPATVSNAGAMQELTNQQSNAGVLFFFYTFLYDNGVETGYSDSSTPYLWDGKSRIQLSNLSLGPDIGDAVCIARRVYFTGVRAYNGTYNHGPLGDEPSRPFSELMRYAELANNTDTSFSTDFGYIAPSSADVVRHQVFQDEYTLVKPLGRTSSPAYSHPEQIMTAQVATTDVRIGDAEYFPSLTTYPINGATAGNFSYSIPAGTEIYFFVSNLYRNFTMSKRSKRTNTIVHDGVSDVKFTNVPLGEDINGVDCIARFVEAFFVRPRNEDNRDAQSSGILQAWALIPNNTATSRNTSPQLIARFTSGLSIGGDGSNPSDDPDAPPVWPNDDGPDPEATLDQPDDITDENEDLLREPAITLSEDLSQLRNRVFVKGVGTSLAEAAEEGDVTLSVSDCRFIANAGVCQLFAGGRVVIATGTDQMAGPGLVFLSEPLQSRLGQGEAVNLFTQVDDPVSQQERGRIEVDSGGQATQGIYEYMVTDTTLTTMSQMFMRGLAELEMFAYPIRKVTYATRDSKTRSGATVHIKLSDPPIAGDFLIQDVTIDQIHDESDILTPRYNVTASSVRFELNDLLLRIIENGAGVGSGGGVYGGSSVTNAGITNTTINSQSNLVAAIGNQKTGEIYPMQTSGALVSIRGVGISAAASGSTPTYPNPNDGNIPSWGEELSTRANKTWAVFATAAPINSTAGYIGGEWFFLEQNFEFLTEIWTGAIVTELIYWVGMGNNGIMTTKDGTNNRFCMFRYSPGDGDGGWVGAMNPGGVGHGTFVTAPLMGVFADTRYRMRMKSEGGPISTDMSVSFKVEKLTHDGALEIASEWTTVTWEQTARNGSTPDHDLPIDWTVLPQSGMALIMGVVTKKSGGLSDAIRKINWRRTAIAFD